MSLLVTGFQGRVTLALQAGCSGVLIEGLKSLCRAAARGCVVVFVEPAGKAGRPLSPVAMRRSIALQSSTWLWSFLEPPGTAGQVSVWVILTALCLEYTISKTDYYITVQVMILLIKNLKTRLLLDVCRTVLYMEKNRHVLDHCV